MTQYLVTFSIGPVQGMIASARRSRDLWSGSWLLSELSKTCAKSLKDNGTTLIFPHIENDKDLDENSEFSVGNKIQALVEVDNLEQLQTVIQHAKQATHQRFYTEVEKAWDNLSNYKQQLRDDIWTLQKKDYVEIQVAWAVIDNNNYQQAVQNVGRTLASRKATRDFNPSATSPYCENLMLPKSSLDGMRETVIREEKDAKGKVKELPKGLRAKLSLSGSEQLDTLGVVKRLGFDKNEKGEKVAEQFTPITRVMADAWIQEIATQAPQALETLKDIYHALVGQEVATRVTGNQGIYAKFPYDAQLLYPSRWEVEYKKWQGNDDVILGYLDNLKDVLRPLYKKYGEPYRYGVLLQADGDRMGELLDNAETLEDHQAITKALSNFAGKVAETMRKKEYRGHCIYAGGDDVLGFVPLDKAYQCADALQKLFADSLKDVAEKLNAKTAPTLSVGLAICHIMTPLGVIRELAQQAEKYAKGDHIKQGDTKQQRRNALGILLSVRSGTDTKLRFNWNDDVGLATFIEMTDYYVKSAIPSRVAYDIRAIHLRTCGFALHDENLQQDIQIAELTRMLKQARTDKGQKIEPNIIDGLTKRAIQIGLDRLADELIVARWFAAKTQKELGKE